MKARDRRGFVELAILLTMLVPGGGLFFWGLHSCQQARHFGVPGAVAVVAGLCLTLAGGFYHYRTDYRDRNRQDAGDTGERQEARATGDCRQEAGVTNGSGGVRAFLAITLVSTLAAVLAHRLLLR